MQKSIIIVLLLFISLTPLLTQAQETAPTPFIKMLALVPDSEAFRLDASGMITYSNLTGAYEASGLPGFATAAEFEAADEEAKSLFLLTQRRADFYEFSAYQAVQMTDMPALTGLERFDIEQVMQWGSPPNIGLALAGDFDLTAMNDALLTRDFQQLERDGVAVWYRFEDDSVNVTAREPGDPFGGAIGAAARLASIEDLLINTRNWGLMETVIATSRDNYPSLLDAPDYGALAAAFEDPAYYEGELISAILLSTSASLSTAVPPRNPLDIVTAGTPQPASPTPDPALTLPPYALLGMADRQEGDQTVHLIGLVYPDAATAELAGQVLTARLQNDDLLFGAFTENYDLRFDEPHVYTGEDGVAVTIVGVRYTIVTEPVVSDGGMDTRIPQPGLLFYLWYQALTRRDLYFLSSEPRPSTYFGR